MAIENLYLPYPDFKLQEIIDPEQFDTNNEYTKSKINEVLNVLNQLLDSATDGASGADLIQLTPVVGFVSTKLQLFLEEVVETLRHKNGSNIVGTPDNEGVSGTTVGLQLRSLKVLFDAVKVLADQNKTDLQGVVLGQIPDGTITQDKLAFAIVSDATSVSITDTANYYTGINAELALQEIGLAFAGTRTSLNTSVTALLGV